MPPVDEDIMRDLMVRATADLFAPPAAAAEAVRRQRRHRVRNRALSAVGDRRRGRAGRRETSALRDYLLAQAKQQIAQANQFFRQQLKQAEKEHPGLKGKKAIGPSPQPTDNDLVFEQAADTLWEPNLSPQLRSALYKVLAATPGVTVQTGARDSAGRPAVEISRTDTVAKTEVQTFENPKTGATLESAWRQASGELDEDLYLSISYTNAIPSDPYQG